MLVRYDSLRWSPKEEFNLCLTDISLNLTRSKTLIKLICKATTSVFLFPSNRLMFSLKSLSSKGLCFLIRQIIIRRVTSMTLVRMTQKVRKIHSTVTTKVSNKYVRIPTEEKNPKSIKVKKQLSTVLIELKEKGRN